MAASQNSVPSVVSRTIQGQRYECQPGEHGLEFTDTSNDRTRYEADVSQYLPLTTPKLTKAGKIAKRQPYVPAKTAPWWRAQCAFRGLQLSGAIAKLQERVRQHGNKGMSPVVRGGFVLLSREYDEQVWNRLDEDGRAASLPERFLKETLGPSGSKQDQVLVVTVGGWANSITEAARSLGIACETVKMPHFATGQRLVVVGNDPLQVCAKMAKHQHETDRARQRAAEEKRAHEEEARTKYEKSLKTAKAKDRNVKGEWDVRGKWQISCPDIEQQWGAEGQMLELSLEYTEPNYDDSVEVYADFDFAVLTGIMRFVDPNLTSTSQFTFKQSSLPSSSCKSFNFRWRGEETGMGEIQLGSDKELSSITFLSPHALNGVFKAGFVGEQSFTGIKVSSRGARLDPAYLWSQRSEAAYEHARVARWH